MLMQVHLENRQCHLAASLNIELAHMLHVCNSVTLTATFCLLLVKLFAAMHCFLLNFVVFMYCTPRS